MVMCNISEPCWRLLQRLKIVVSKESVEKWMKMYKKQVENEDSVLFYVFDNCNFHLHVSKVRSDHRSSYLNIINHFIVELPIQLEVSAILLWQNVDRKKFGEWLASTNDESNTWADSN